MKKSILVVALLSAFNASADIEEKSVESTTDKVKAFFNEDTAQSVSVGAANWNDMSGFGVAYNRVINDEVVANLSFETASFDDSNTSSIYNTNESQSFYDLAATATYNYKFSDSFGAYATGGASLYSHESTYTWARRDDLSNGESVSADDSGVSFVYELGLKRSVSWSEVYMAIGSDFVGSYTAAGIDFRVGDFILDISFRGYSATAQVANSSADTNSRSSMTLAYQF